MRSFSKDLIKCNCKYHLPKVFTKHRQNWRKIHMKRKKVIIIAIIASLICITSIIVVFCFSRNLQKQRAVVKIGVIDSYIPKETLESMNILNTNYTGSNSHTSNNHGKVTLKIIQDECKNSKIYYASVLNEENTSPIEDVVSAIEWCIDNKVDVICMSFATFTDDELLKSIVEKAISNNIIITASCVNFSNADCYPAMYNGVISVSEGFNKNATIIMKKKSLLVEIDGENIEGKGTSALNAYACGCIAKEISRGNNDLGKVIDKIVKKCNN